jgi:hypothetical protein
MIAAGAQEAAARFAVLSEEHDEGAGVAAALLLA